MRLEKGLRLEYRDLVARSRIYGNILEATRRPPVNSLPLAPFLSSFMFLGSISPWVYHHHKKTATFNAIAISTATSKGENTTEITGHNVMCMRNGFLNTLYLMITAT